MPSPTHPSCHTRTPTRKAYTLNFTGDVMLARLIDQLFPTHLPAPREESIISTYRREYPYLCAGKYTHASPWGSALGLFKTADLNLVNLETAATTTNEAWPGKMFNYRMHPANLGVLTSGCVDYVSLANNHTLDYGSEGLVETVWGVRSVGVKFAGVGVSTDESRRPAVLDLPRRFDYGAGRRWSEREMHGGHGHERLSDASALRGGQVEDSHGGGGPGQQQDGNGEVMKHHKIHVYSASDHPYDWSVVPTFHLIDYSPTTRKHLKTLLNRYTPSPSPSSPQQPPALKIFSIHWGPNYSWHPSSQIRGMAHFLIDECGVDIVHGHSAHHVQGVERYRGKLVMYGCGDFVDDYALNERFRNDLGGVWRVIVRETVGASNANGDDAGTGRDGDGETVGLELDRLEVYPTRCDRFQVTLLDSDDEDHGWVTGKIAELSEDMGTKVEPELGEEGQLVINLKE